VRALADFNTVDFITVDNNKRPPITRGERWHMLANALYELATGTEVDLFDYLQNPDIPPIYDFRRR
jgi:hypothetical protein